MQSHNELKRLAITIEGSLLILSVLLAWTFRLPLLDNLRWNGWDIALGIGFSFPMFVLLFFIVHNSMGPIRGIKDIFDTVLIPLLQPCSMWDFAWMSLLAGVAEELLFRGVLQIGLGRLLSPGMGVLLAGILFGLAHCITIFYAVIAGAIGIYLGLIFMYSNNLLTVITAHAVYDFFALLYLVKFCEYKPVDFGSVRK